MAQRFTIPAPCEYRVGNALQRRIFARDGFACAYCGARKVLRVDHVTPCAHFPADASRAVVNDPSNLVTACETCNGSKGPQNLASFASMLRGRGVPNEEVDAMLVRVRRALRKSV